MCAPEIVAFGTVTPFAEGIEHVMDAQWHKVWGNIREFTVHDDAGPRRDRRRSGVGGDHLGLAGRQTGRLHVPAPRPLHGRARAARRSLAGHPHALLALSSTLIRETFMHIGVCIFATEYAIRIDELAREAEDRGFESLWVPEHTHIPTSRRSPFAGGATLPEEYKHTLDPFVSLMAAAAVTKKLRVGTGICLIIERDTITTAKSVASARSAVERPLRSRHRRRLERRRDGASRNNLQVPLPAHARAGAGHEGAVDEGRGRVPRRLRALRAVWAWPKPSQKPHPPVLPRRREQATRCSAWSTSATAGSRAAATPSACSPAWPSSRSARPRPDAT